MRTATAGVGFGLWLAVGALATAEPVPFDSERWKIAAEEHEVRLYHGRQALFLKNGNAWIDDLDITDGVIRFDISFGAERGFSGAIWRMRDADNFEEFYLRHHQSGNPDANQYTPIFNASAAWQLYHGPGYGTPVRYRDDEWMSVEIRFSGSQAEVYIDSEEPILSIAELKHAVGPGKVGVMSSYAPAFFSNFSVTPGTPRLRAPQASDLYERPAGVVTEWLVSDEFSFTDLDAMVTLDSSVLGQRSWRRLPAERDGITNLARVARLSSDGDTVFAKVLVDSLSAQTGNLSFGYSDNARLYVNKRLVYSGTNAYRSRDYRYLGTIGLFDAVAFDLKPGLNEILFAVQENFGGWGVMARLTDTPGAALVPAGQVPAQVPPVTKPVAIAIHGGAGTVLKSELSADQELAIRQTLEAAIRAGHRVLTGGGSSLDAVQAAIVLLEDSPLFNAGKGAVFNHEGVNELDAAIMDGASGNAGAVAGLTRVRNPILAARRVMEGSPHVLLFGAGAEAFALEQGLTLVDPEYFHTEKRWQQLQKALAREKEFGLGQVPGPDRVFSTVGAVALDRHGNLAAGTSTGGLTNKRYGRVGDVPVIGAGTYANNQSCAVSATGHGEYFIRSVVAHDICSQVAYRGSSLAEATEEVVMKKLVDRGGRGGVIAIDPKGAISMQFNTEGMYRAAIGVDGELVIEIYAEADPAR